MERKEILDKLARHEITQTQAEEMLSAQGSPIPQAPPAAPVPSSSNSSKGCLIALIITILIVPLIILALFFLSFAQVKEVRRDQEHEATMHRERVKKILESEMKRPSNHPPELSIDEPQKPEGDHR